MGGSSTGKRNYIAINANWYRRCIEAAGFGLQADCNSTSTKISTQCADSLRWSSCCPHVFASGRRIATFAQECCKLKNFSLFFCFLLESVGRLLIDISPPEL